MALATGVGNPSGALSASWGSGAPGGITADAWSARFSGEMYLPSTDFYNFAATSDDGVRIYFDDRLVGDHWAMGAGTTPNATVWGTAGWHALPSTTTTPAGRPAST